MTFYTSSAKISKDPIVGLLSLAGKDDHPNKLTAIIGSIAGDDGKLLVPEVVTQSAQELTQDGINMAYAPSSGIPKLAALFAEEILGKKTCAALEAANIKRSQVISSGGTNAIATTLLACTTDTDTIITHNPHWAGYDSVIGAINRKPLVNFDILSSRQDFNIQAFADLIDTVAKSNDKLNILLNTPFDNPLGKDFGQNTWQKIAEVLAQYSNKEIIMILDTAYLDFGLQGKDYRRLNFIPELFKTINNDKFNLVIAGTASKSFAMYGARVGIAVLLTSNQENSENWVDNFGGSIRGTFSNGNRTGQEIVLNILEDPSKLARLHCFHEEAADLLQKRKEFFVSTMSQSPHENLELIEPDSGFFVSIRLKDQNFIDNYYQTLLDDHFYAPLISNQFLRIPICGLNENKLAETSERLIKAAKLVHC